MLTAAGVLGIGLVALLGGGEVLVRGSTALAKKLGISPLVIGMTVVAFGTSVPELAVNVTAVLGGNEALSFGNVVGSCYANIGLILGTAAFLRPMKVASSTLSREFPFMVAATAAFCFLSLDALWRGAPSAIDRADGVIFLGGFVVFVALALRTAMRTREPSASAGPHWALALLMTGTGIAGVLYGSQWTVEGAVGIARGLGVDEALIGLTVVAIGTSLPELATSLLAVRSGQGDLALGNVVGSNVFNILLVLGVTATVGPIPVPDVGLYDLVALGSISLALWLMAATHRHRLVRWEGGLLLVAYLGYVGWRAFA